MNVSAVAYRRLAWINLPAALLITLLQRTPVVRVFSGAGDYVLSSPIGQLLRGVLTAATLGAIHSRAGATTFVQNPQNPVRGTVGSPFSVAFTYTGTPSAPARFRVTGGTLPAGLDFEPKPVSGNINSGTPAITGTPTQAGSFSVFVQGFNSEGLTNGTQQEIQIEISGGTSNTAPTISAQPQNQTVTVGGSASFTVAANGTPAPTFQWRRNGANIAGATNATLTLTNVQLSDAGTYSVVVTNSAGSVTSNNGTLTVNTAATSVAITAQPASQTIASGHTVVFSVGATGATGYQWRRDGANLAGATNATLVINNAAPSNAGAYSVVVSGAAGASATSSAASLSVVNTSDFGRLINLSILTDIPTAGAEFTLGYVVGGASAANVKPLVIRAAGPSLGAAPINYPGTLDDPKIELFAGSTKSGENDNWGGAAATVAAMAGVGAFPYVNANSRDAAAAINITTRDNSVKVSASGTGTGNVIAEIYDATPSASFNANTPRLVNVSVLKPIGAKLTMGFVVGGSTSKTVLVRAVGPTLGGAPFNISGVVADPQLTLFGPNNVRFGENNDWGNATALSEAFQSVGAFGLLNGSRDAVLLITLPPNNYTVDVTGAANTTGIAIIEVYEVP